MHAAPMADSEGVYDEWQLAETEGSDGTKAPWACRKCGGIPVYYRTWESSDGGYEDIQYHCRACGRKWWVEGADA